jgi:hypothetical protein
MMLLLAFVYVTGFLARIACMGHAYESRGFYVFSKKASNILERDCDKRSRIIFIGEIALLDSSRGPP